MGARFCLHRTLRNASDEQRKVFVTVFVPAILEHRTSSVFGGRSRGKSTVAEVGANGEWVVKSGMLNSQEGEGGGVLAVEAFAGESSRKPAYEPASIIFSPSNKIRPLPPCDAAEGGPDIVTVLDVEHNREVTESDCH
jgi:hypothetical protein